MEITRSVDPRRDAVLALSASAIALAAPAAILLALLARQPLAGMVLFLVAAAFALARILRFQATRTEEERSLSRARRDARAMLLQLYAWKQHGRLKRMLGAGVGELLDQGGRYWMECRAALGSDVWNSAGAGAPWAGVRERAVKAMDAAMARLLVLAGSANCAESDFLSPGYDSCHKMVEEMRRMAREARRLTDKLVVRTASEFADSPVSELQEALGEMRRLEAAEDELDQLDNLD